jgi:hypothetical protein
MNRALFLTLLLLPRVALAQSDTVTAPAIPMATNAVPASKLAPAPKMSRAAMTSAQLQKAVDQLTQSNRDLLDLLRQQQKVLEDMQYDRRQQTRRVESLEVELTDARMQNSQLQNKIAALEADAAVRPPVNLQPFAAAAPVPGAGIADASNPGAPTNSVVITPEPRPASPPPETYLPAPDTEGAPGTKSWHRLFTLKGSDAKQSDLFHISGKSWRVIWHNQDPPGKNLKGTSGLFIDAFPKDDTIPQHVCAKVGTGGEKTELEGPGNYYLKVTASGGSWELAVEDFE